MNPEEAQNRLRFSNFKPNACSIWVVFAIIALGESYFIPHLREIDHFILIAAAMISALMFVRNWRRAYNALEGNNNP